MGAELSLAGNPLFTQAIATKASSATEPNTQGIVQAGKASGKPLPPVTADTLPNLLKNPRQRAPYLAEISASLTKISTYMGEHLAPGLERKNALEALDHFGRQRLNPNNLSLITLNQNRSNLQQLAQALSNPDVPANKKLNACIQLAQGLGVCAEGECLNIAEATAMLTNSEQGLAGHIVQAKNQLIDQHLLEAVRASHNNSQSDVVKSLEIHDVQCLKNAVAHEWGLASVADRHMSSTYQARMAPAVSATLQELITPRALAEVVADKLEQALVEQTQGNLKTGMPSANLLTDPLEKAIQAEFGQQIELSSCLALSDDYATVTLAPRVEIVAHLMQGFQAVGLLPKTSDVGMLAKADLPPAGLMATRCTGLGLAARPQIYAPNPASTPPATGHDAFADTLAIDLTLFFLGMRPVFNAHNSPGNNPAKRKPGEPMQGAGSAGTLGHDFQRLGVKVTLDQHQHNDRAKRHQ